MVKKALKTIAWLVACALMASPVVIVYMIAWVVFMEPSIFMKLTGAFTLMVGIILTPLPAKVTYFIIREVWDPNFKWEFEIPLGG